MTSVGMAIFFAVSVGIVPSPKLQDHIRVCGLPVPFPSIEVIFHVFHRLRRSAPAFHENGYGITRPTGSYELVDLPFLFGKPHNPGAVGRFIQRQFGYFPGAEFRGSEQRERGAGRRAI